MKPNVFADASNVYLNEEYVLVTRKRLEEITSSSLSSTQTVIDAKNIKNHICAIVYDSSDLSYKVYRLSPAFSILSDILVFKASSHIFVIGSKFYITGCSNGDFFGLYYWDTEDELGLTPISDASKVYIPKVSKDSSGNIIIGDEELNILTNRYSTNDTGHFSQEAYEGTTPDDVRNASQTYIASEELSPSLSNSYKNSNGDTFEVTLNTRINTIATTNLLGWTSREYQVYTSVTVTIRNNTGIIITSGTSDEVLKDTYSIEANAKRVSHVLDVVPCGITTSGQVATYFLMVQTSTDSRGPVSGNFFHDNMFITVSGGTVTLYEFKPQYYTEDLLLDYERFVVYGILSMNDTNAVPNISFQMNGYCSDSGNSTYPYIACSRVVSCKILYNPTSKIASTSYTGEDVYTFYSAYVSTGETTNWLMNNFPKSVSLIKSGNTGYFGMDIGTLSSTTPAGTTGWLTTGKTYILKVVANIVDLNMSATYTKSVTVDCSSVYYYLDNLYARTQAVTTITSKNYRYISGMSIVNDKMLFWMHSIDDNKYSTLMLYNTSIVEMVYIVADISIYRTLERPDYQTGMFIGTTSHTAIICHLTTSDVLVVSGTWSSETVNEKLVYTMTNITVNGLFSIAGSKKKIGGSSVTDITDTVADSADVHILSCKVEDWTLNIVTNKYLDSPAFIEKYYIDNFNELSPSDGKAFYNWQTARNLIGEFTGIYAMNNFLIYTGNNGFVYSSTYDDTYVEVTTYEPTPDHSKINEVMVISPTAAIMFTEYATYWIIGSGEGNITNLTPVVSQFNIANVRHGSTIKLAMNDIPTALTEKGIFTFEGNSEVTDTSKNLGLLTENVDVLYGKFYDSAAFIGVFRSIWFNIYFMAGTGNSTDLLLYDCRGGSWWRWQFANVAILHIFEYNGIIYTVSREGAIFTLYDAIEKCYDTIGGHDYKIEWLLQSHPTALGIVSKGKTMTGTTMVWGHNLAINRVNSEITDIDYADNTFRIRLVAYTRPNIRDAIIFDINDRVHQLSIDKIRTYIPKFNYISYILSNKDALSNGNLGLSLSALIFDFKVLPRLA